MKQDISFYLKAAAEKSIGLSSQRRNPLLRRQPLTEQCGQTMRNMLFLLFYCFVPSTQLFALDTIFLVDPQLLGGQLEQRQEYESDGSKGWGYDIYSYNDKGQMVREQWYDSDGSKFLYQSLQLQRQRTNGAIAGVCL